jgi:hypothetical protein
MAGRDQEVVALSASVETREHWRVRPCPSSHFHDEVDEPAGAENALSRLKLHPLPVTVASGGRENAAP